jgi:hypothetical protein
MVAGISGSMGILTANRSSLRPYLDSVLTRGLLCSLTIRLFMPTVRTQHAS